MVGTMLVCCGVMTSLAQTVPTETMNTPHSSLVKQFQACVSPTGLTRDLPLADPAPPLDSSITLLSLNEVGKIRDGYRHFLYVNHDASQIYIIQIGGIAGLRKVFGPLKADPALCR